MWWGGGLGVHHIWSGGDGGFLGLRDNGWHIVQCCRGDGWKWRRGRRCRSGDGRRQRGGRGSDWDGCRCAADERVAGEPGKTAADGVVVDDATLSLNPTRAAAGVDAAVLEAGEEGRTLAGYHTLWPARWGIADEASLARTPPLLAHFPADGVGSTRVALAGTPRGLDMLLGCREGMHGMLSLRIRGEE